MESGVDFTCRRAVTSAIFEEINEFIDGSRRPQFSLG